MIRSIVAAAGVAMAGLLVLAAPAAADDPPQPPPLPSLEQLGINPYVNVCAGFSTPIPFIGVGGCSPDITEQIGIG
jgi:hypothetical protein